MHRGCLFPKTKDSKSTATKRHVHTHLRSERNEIHLKRQACTMRIPRNPDGATICYRHGESGRIWLASLIPGANIQSIIGFSLARRAFDH